MCVSTINLNYLFINDIFFNCLDDSIFYKLYLFKDTILLSNLLKDETYAYNNCGF